MTAIQALETECQKMLYGRRRIVNALYKLDPSTKDILETDIDSITLEDDKVVCHIGEKRVPLPRAEVLKNFWEHRTRTPSYFSHKIWMQFHLKGRKFEGWPIATLNYDGSTTTEALVEHIGRSPKVSVDREGTKRIYFVKPEEGSCTCNSWVELNKYKNELEEEFSRFTSIKFKPVCKHMQWHSANLNLHATSYHAKQQIAQYNPRICVYYYDHRRASILYRVTSDGVKSGGKWFPEDSWKEKLVYDSGGNPTGNCWEVLNGALEHKYSLQRYSELLALRMSQSSKK